MNQKATVDGMYTPGSEFSYGEDIINMITYLNKFSGMEQFMNIGYADSLIEYFLFPVGLSSKRLPERLAKPLLDRPNDFGTVLVVGCGRGGEAVLLHELTGCTITGVDITPFNIETAQKYTKKMKVNNKVSFLVGNACELPVDSESVSCVFSCESAFHYRYKERFIKESYRVLKKSGLLLIADIVKRKPLGKLSVDEKKTLKEFETMLAIPEFFTLEEYKKHMAETGFRNIIDCEVISNHNIGYLAAYSGRLLRIFTLLEKLPRFKAKIKTSFKRKKIDIENFLAHSRTTAEAVKSELVDYIIISAEK